MVTVKYDEKLTFSFEIHLSEETNFILKHPVSNCCIMLLLRPTVIDYGTPIFPSKIYIHPVIYGKQITQ